MKNIIVVMILLTCFKSYADQSWLYIAGVRVWQKDADDKVKTVKKITNDGMANAFNRACGIEENKYRSGDLLTYNPRGHGQQVHQMNVRYLH